MYIYLREGQSKNWMSLKLHTAQLSALNHLVHSSGDTGTNGGIRAPAYGPYPHCKTILHGGGKNACPWKDETSAEAKKKSKKALIRLGSGNADVEE